MFQLQLHVKVAINIERKMDLIFPKFTDHKVGRKLEGPIFLVLLSTTVKVSQRDPILQQDFSGFPCMSANEFRTAFSNPDV